MPAWILLGWVVGTPFSSGLRQPRIVDTIRGPTGDDNRMRCPLVEAVRLP